ncbi:response regulator [Planctomycetota bacterium]
MDTSPTVLIVDDDPNLTKTLSDILKVKGYVPSTAPDGKTAIERIRQEAPVAALIDLKLPDMSGLDVLREIKAHSPATECIVLTGHASQESAIKAIYLGAYSYIEKPYDVASLLLTIIRAKEKHTAEKERERLIAELKAKNTELERFTYTVSHDLKSPLITIRGFLGVLEKDAAEGNIERLKADTMRINAAAEKMQQLLDVLLELSRIGQVVNLPEEAALGDIAHEAVELVAGRINDRGVQVEISPDLPVVCGDRLRLREVLQNLIDNAAKFMGDQPEPLIEIGVRQDGDKTVFYVRDNGMGIESRYQEKVFGLFDQLEPNKKGTGVGLALVKRIVELHGGRIWVESEGAGRGSTFYFTILSKSALQGSHKELTYHET